jgi:hypothetical protein
MFSVMTPLNYVTEVPFRCKANNVNVMTFTEAATIIRGRDVV